MANPGDLVKVLADVLGVPRPTVALHDRHLAAAGLRPKRGRGPSAAKATPLGAANLLIGIAGSDMVKNSVETVTAYASLPCRSAQSTGDGSATLAWQLLEFPIPTLQLLPEKHSFRDALVALISAIVDGSLQKAVAALPIEEFEGYRIPNSPAIRVRFFGPYPQAEIGVFCRGFREEHHYSAIPTGTADAIKWADAQEPHGDLSQVREISHRTICAIGDLLHG